MKPVLPMMSVLLAAGLLSPAWPAPYVAYVGNVPVHSDSAHAKVMVVDVADGTAVNVSEGLASARAPAWSPDGELLAFEAIENGFCDVFVCKPDGGDRRNVTSSLEVWNGSPCLVDGQRVAFLSGPDRTDVWLTDLVTGETRQLTREPLFNKPPVPAPDGAVLAVVGSAKLGGPGDIYLVTVDGGETTNLTQAPARYSTPAFSPDGKTLAFSFDGRDIGGARRGVARMPVAGGAPELLAQDGYPLGPLCFSADGARIAYTSAATYHSTWVRVMQADGRDNSPINPSPAHIIGWPSFTPDGKGLAYQGVHAAKYTVRLLDLETGKNRALSPDNESGVTPVCPSR